VVALKVILGEAGNSLINAARIAGQYHISGKANWFRIGERSAMPGRAAFPWRGDLSSGLVALPTIFGGSLFSRNDTSHCGAIVCSKTIPSVEKENPPWALQMLQRPSSGGRIFPVC
jgi:hypothetical protein